MVGQLDLKLPKNRHFDSQRRAEGSLPYQSGLRT